jgi:hypothetical protein
MNKRIRELYEQAHEEQSPISGQGRLTKDILWEQPKKFNPEKFAELIVRQMLEITDAHTEVFQTDRDRAVIEHIKKSVRQHFGVEE